MDSELPGGTKNKRVFLSPLPHKTLHNNYDKRDFDCVEGEKHARKPCLSMNGLYLHGTASMIIIFSTEYAIC